MLDGQTFGVVITGLIVGSLSGLLGTGGAIFMVPALVLFFGFSQGRAQGTSIGALVPPIGVFAAIQYYRAGLLDVRVAMLLGLGFLLGALGGATLVPHLPQIWLRRGFASLLACVAAQLMFVDPSERVGAALPTGVAVAGLWTVWLIRRALGRKAPPPSPPRAPPPPDVEYYI